MKLEELQAKLQSDSAKPKEPGNPLALLGDKEIPFVPADQFAWKSDSWKARLPQDVLSSLFQGLLALRDTLEVAVPTPENLNDRVADVLFHFVSNSEKRSGQGLLVKLRDGGQLLVQGVRIGTRAFREFGVKAGEIDLALQIVDLKTGKKLKLSIEIDLRT